MGSLSLKSTEEGESVTFGVNMKDGDTQTDEIY